MSQGTHYADLMKGRRLEDMSPNELRAKLAMAGVDIPEDVKTKAQLVALVKLHC